MNAPKTPDPGSLDQVFDLPVAGLRCAGCVAKVERAVAALPGVRSAQANFAAARLRVVGGRLCDVVAALAAIGYPAVLSQTELLVVGLHCASCISRVEAALTAVPGVASAAANLATGQVLVRHAPGAVDPAQLVLAVQAAGYQVAPQAGDTQAAGAVLADRLSARALENRKAANDALLAALGAAPLFIRDMAGHVMLLRPGARGMAMAAPSLAWTLISLALAGFVLAVPGRALILRGLKALSRGAPDMDSLVSVGAVTAFGASLLSAFGPPGLRIGAYFETSALIITLILTGRWLEGRARGRMSEAIEKLAALQARTATRLTPDGDEEEVAIEAIRPGDRVLVRPSDRLPVDGVIVDGRSFLDESLLTGEPMPVERGPGASVVGGTMNGSGALKICVTHIGRETVLAQIGRLVQSAQMTKPRVQALVDKASGVFTPLVFALSLLTLAGWLVLAPQAGLAFALTCALSVLVIACPCAMGLATPTSIMVALGRGAQLGLLFRDGGALESLAAARIVVFDKTGTLTEGKPVLTDVEPADGVTQSGLLSLIAGAEALSEHPLAKALVVGARDRGAAPAAVTNFTARTGGGVEAQTDKGRLIIGSLGFLGGEGVASGAWAARVDALAAQGKTPVLAALDREVIGLVAVSDPVRAGAVETLAALKARGLKTALASGDHALTVGAVAALVDVTLFRAACSPADKAEWIRALRKHYGPVVFVGDGVNDAPALAAADAGLAIGSGTDIALESAGVILPGGDPRLVLTALDLARATRANIAQNLVWAFAYNVLLMPLAAGLFYPAFGLRLTPAPAAGAMALSSLTVLFNALRLKAFHRGKETW